MLGDTEDGFCVTFLALEMNRDSITSGTRIVGHFIVTNQRPVLVDKGVMPYTFITEIDVNLILVNETRAVGAGDGGAV